MGRVRFDKANSRPFHLAAAFVGYYVTLWLGGLLVVGVVKLADIGLWGVVAGLLVWVCYDIFAFIWNRYSPWSASVVENAEVAG